MKNHWAFKLTAFVLAVISTAVLAVSGLVIAVGYAYDLYEDDSADRVETLVEQRMDNYAYHAASVIASKFDLEKNTMPDTVEYTIWLDWIGSWYDIGYWPECEYTIYEVSTGNQVANTKYSTVDYVKTLTQTVSIPTGKVVSLGSDEKAFPSCDQLPVDYVWTDHFGKALPGLDAKTVYYDLVFAGNGRVYRVEHFEESQYRVNIHLTREDMNFLEQNVQQVSLIRAAEPYVGLAIPAAVISAVIALASFLYLGFAAGKKPGTDEILPRGTNRLPLDLVAVGGGLGFFALISLGYQLSENTVYTSNVSGVYWYIAGFALCAGAAGLVAALMLTALCAQVRLGKRAWLKGTAAGKCWGFCWACVKKALRFVGTLIRMVPLMWQWLLVFGAWLLMLLVASLDIYYHAGLWLVVAFSGALLVLYGAYALGKLRHAAKRMRNGDLDTKIDTKKEFLCGNFREFAGDLNALGDTCVEAAVERTKSERMKSELITNVSHDIKTPLTSIINYVDLLQRAETEEQKAEYLEVLDRQSQRLKRLIEDLMEMSKASSGNIAVELAPTDVVEAVNQALGEFADRLEAMDLNIVFRQSGGSVSASCDGKLLWRVMSNVLVNVVKYALPGTRVYIDVLVVENKVCLSFKNISREPLNISAEELMERFVRGDRSRNSEGSGLGLNIARSLMEAQGGELSLSVDGDLFKVTLTLNAG